MSCVLRLDGRGTIPNDDGDLIYVTYSDSESVIAWPTVQNFLISLRYNDFAAMLCAQQHESKVRLLCGVLRKIDRTMENPTEGYLAAN